METGKGRASAHLEDYAFFSQGLLDLYEATLASEYLIEAKALTDTTRSLFEDRENGGFFLTAEDREPLLVRAKEIYDGAIPSGNSVMALNLVRLSKFTGDSTYRECAHSFFPPLPDFFKKTHKAPRFFFKPWISNWLRLWRSWFADLPKLNKRNRS